MHKSEKFWSENAQRLDEKEFELIKKLIYLLESTNDVTNICVACFDIGEYVRFNPSGKVYANKKTIRVFEFIYIIHIVKAEPLKHLVEKRS